MEEGSSLHKELLMDEIKELTKLSILTTWLVCKASCVGGYTQDSSFAFH